MKIVKVFTSSRKLKNKNNYEKFNDAFFNNNIELTDLTVLDRQIIKEIDNAKILDTGQLSTPFGLCTIFELSSGTKTIINILHYSNKIFDVTSCGENALDLLFRLINNTDISIVLSHSEFYIPEDITLLVNREHYIKFFFDYGILLNRDEL